MERSIFIHVASTWILAHALKILVSILISFMFPDTFAYSALFVVPLGSARAIFSTIPAIFIFWGILHFLLKTSFTPEEKLFGWIVFAALTVAIYAYLLILLKPEDDLNFVMGFFVPDDRSGYDGMRGVDIYGRITPIFIATILSVLIRRRQFLSLNEHLMDIKEKKGSSAPSA